MDDDKAKRLIEKMLGILKERAPTDEDLSHFDEQLKRLGINIKSQSAKSKRKRHSLQICYGQSPLLLWRMYLRREELDRKLFGTSE